VNLGATKTRVFAVSAAYAGVAGALYVFAIGFVAPEAFTLTISFAFLAAIVVGGLATISGAIFGALFIEFVPVYASDVNDALTGVIYGGVLIAFMWVLPEGAAGLLGRVRELVNRRRDRREWASEERDLTQREGQDEEGADRVGGAAAGAGDSARRVRA
jgi:branched-chain amino acid transport system permease protein